MSVKYPSILYFTLDYAATHCIDGMVKYYMTRTPEMVCFTYALHLHVSIVIIQSQDQKNDVLEGTILYVYPIAIVYVSMVYVIISCIYSVYGVLYRYRSYL